MTRCKIWSSYTSFDVEWRPLVYGTVSIGNATDISKSSLPLSSGFNLFDVAFKYCKYDELQPYQ